MQWWYLFPPHFWCSIERYAHLGVKKIPWGTYSIQYRLQPGKLDYTPLVHLKNYYSLIYRAANGTGYYRYINKKVSSYEVYTVW